jgi:HEAT repeat protein
MLAEGQTKEAVAVYRQMAAPANSTWIRIAAYKGLTSAEKADAVPHVMALLKDPDLDLQRAAGQFIIEMPGTSITKALAEQLGQLGADAQVVLLGALEGRGDKAAAPYVAQLVGSTSEPVRLAAIGALAVLGDASSVELLAKASADDSAAGRAAMDSLGRLSGPGVAQALVAVAKSDAAVPVRINAIGALVNRHETEAIDALLAVAADNNPDVRQAAYKALGALAGQSELAKMVSMLIAAGGDADRAGIERAMIAVAARLEAPDAAPVIAGLAKADDTVKPYLLVVLARFGGPDALAAVRSQLGANDAKLKSAAIRALAAWPDASPLSDLMNIARSENDAACQVLALRGYIKLLEIPANRGASQTVVLLAEAMSAAKGTDEKKAVLSALARYPCEEAIGVAESAKKDSALAAEAELALNELKKALASKNLKAQASLNEANAHLALDGNPGTRWDTGRGMKPGDWFVLDLGVESTVNGLTLDTTGSANDFPQDYEVYVSFDGGSWGKPVITGKGTQPITEIKFANPVRTRFVRIVQTGSSESWFWSIHELKIDAQ